jgi:hypothetical protein
MWGMSNGRNCTTTAGTHTILTLTPECPSGKVHSVCHLPLSLIAFARSGFPPFPPPPSLSLSLCC